MRGEVALHMEGTESLVHARAFIDATYKLLRLLGEVEKAISSTKQSRLKWTVGTLNSGSACIGLAPLSTEDLPYTGEEVARTTVEGLDMLERGIAHPPYFSEQALRLTGNLAGVVGGYTKNLRVRIDDLTVDLTPNLSRRVDDLLTNVIEELGTIDGTLKMISVAGKQPVYNIYDSITNVPVNCVFELDFLDTITKAFGRRVEISGLITYSALGRPQRIREVREISIFPPDDELPTAKDLLRAGLDLSGGLSFDEFIRETHHERS